MNFFCPFGRGQNSDRRRRRQENQAPPSHHQHQQLNMENFFQQAFGANPFPRFQGNAASPGGAFDNFFQNFQQVPQHHQAQTDGAVPEASKAPPPASTKVLNELKEIVITADDLIEEGNRSCQICLEDQAPGGRGCKLPCGHLYCLACVRGWLARSCTCPACRFELPTDDAAYEGRRRRRMADRQLRYRPEELSAKPLRELTALCRQLGVPTAGVLEKRGLVDALLASGKIKILEETHVELSLPELQSKSIKELRKIMVDLGISFETCVEKSDMLAAIGRSPKVRLTVPVAAAAAECAAAAATPPRLPGEAAREVGAKEGGEAEAAGLPFGGGGGDGDVEMAEAGPPAAAAREFEGSLKTMSVGDLKRLMRRMNLDPDSCLEKADMIRSILSAR